ncbi:hypothetical protein [Hymenobacter koreensis]|uniref:Lipocalin-like domain-containing protein n=1 Tax=Hymenobacter koreensis TaxID=1084523 RepID=A0ABP8IUK8_9BACT
MRPFRTLFSFSSLLAAAGLLALTACQDDCHAPEPEFGLEGRWVWVSSSCGMSGPHTVESTGRRESVLFAADKAYFFVNDQPKDTARYEILQKQACGGQAETMRLTFRTHVWERGYEKKGSRLVLDGCAPLDGCIEYYQRR